MYVPRRIESYGNLTSERSGLSLLPHEPELFRHV
jgi:hypothetical protein